MLQSASTCEFCGGPVRAGMHDVIVACVACVELTAASDDDGLAGLAERALDRLCARYPTYRYLQPHEQVEVLAVLKASHIQALASLQVSTAEPSD